jgi:hypothetical protein
LVDAVLGDPLAQPPLDGLAANCWGAGKPGQLHIEERFETGKGLCGLDKHQVRRWHSWYRWVTLAMLAHAFLVVAALAERTHHPAPAGLIGLTCNEVQRLFAAQAALPIPDLGHRLRWSVWRRHQARARACQCPRKAA